MPQTPYADSVEEYPHQYASTCELAEKLRHQHDLWVDRDGYALTYLDHRITCEPRKGEPGLWFWVDGVPIDPVMSPDAPMRVADAVRNGPPKMSET